MNHLSMPELEAGLDKILQSPKDHGLLEAIVCRPKINERESLPEGELTLEDGLVGDNWKHRGSSRTADRSAHLDMQLNIMNSRVIALLAQNKDRWQLAGDQLYIDLDLGEENLPPGTKLAIGSAVIVVTKEPHTGCKKFTERYGMDAVKFVNSPKLKHLHLRGINARVIQPGKIKTGDKVTKL